MSRNNFKRFDLAEKLRQHGEIFAEPDYRGKVRIGIREKAGTAAITNSLSATFTPEDAQKFIDSINDALAISAAAAKEHQQDLENE